MNYYRWSEDLARPVTAEIENRSALVVAPVLALHALAKVRIIPLLGLRAYAGLSVDIPFISPASGMSGQDRIDTVKETNQIKEYMLDKNRYIYPVFGFGADLRMNIDWDAGIDFRIWYPLFQKQTGERLPETNNWRFGIAARIIRR
jgi:hypothetical protein